MQLHEFVHENFVIVVNILFLLIFLKTNTVLDKSITKKFLISIAILIMVVIMENINYVLAFRSTTTYNPQFDQLFCAPNLLGSHQH